jgi:hypothetical protein
MGRTAKLEIDDKVIALPAIKGTEQERAIDIGALRASTGVGLPRVWCQSHIQKRGKGAQ